VVEGEVIVLDRAAGLIHQLNPTAAYIWERCDGETTVREIAARLAAAFEIAPELALRDVMTAAQQLQEMRLLEPPPEELAHPESCPKEDPHA
jgi:hypothetical protein